MEETVEAHQFDPRRYAGLLWRRKALISLVTLSVLGVALAFSFSQRPLYEGRVKMLVGQPGALGGLDTAATDSNPARVVKNEIQLIESAPVAAAVARQVGPGTKVAVVASSDSDVVEIHGQAATASLAARSAKAYATAYLDFRRSQSRQNATAAVNAIMAQINDMQSQIDRLNSQISGSESANPGSSSQVSGLVYQRDQLLGQQSPLRDRLTQLQLQLQVGSDQDQIVTTGVIPTSKLRPHPVTTGIAGLVLGLLIAAGAVVALDVFDDSIRTREDLERVVPSAPVLGVLPDVDEWKNPGEAYLVSLSAPDSPSAEAFRTMRTSLLFLGSERPPVVWQIVSANPAEGKSAAITNLAVAMAQGGQRVVLVDCDLRRPRANQFFHLPDRPGFTSVYLGQSSLEAALQHVPGVDGLMILAAGPLPPNPSAVLLAPKTSAIVNELRHHFDVVLVDCPPVLPVSDAVAFSAWADATLLVVGANSTIRSVLKETVTRLRQAGAPLVGTILNRVKAEARYGYQYRYAPTEPAHGDVGSPHAPSLTQVGNPRPTKVRRPGSKGRVSA